MAYINFLLLFFILPLLASCQYNPYNGTNFGFGLSNFSESNPIIVNNQVFQGFNLTIPITSAIDTGNSTNSTDWWSITTTYNHLEVSDITAGLTTFSFGFPEDEVTPGQQWPLNETDWQLCMGIQMTDFPASILNKHKNDSSADCGQYLGEACVTAWSKEYREASLAQTHGCPILPSLYDIKECKHQLDTKQDGGTATDDGPISDPTDPRLIYYVANDSFVDPGTGQVYNSSNVPRQGLSSGEYFAYRETGFYSNSSNLNASLLAEGRQLSMLGLTIVPSDAFKSAPHSNGYGWQANVRMLCVRADVSRSGGSIIQAMPLLAFFSALAATIVAVC